jgi:hypothetical protein
VHRHQRVDELSEADAKRIVVNSNEGDEVSPLYKFHRVEARVSFDMEVIKSYNVLMIKVSKESKFLFDSINSILIWKFNRFQGNKNFFFSVESFVDQTSSAAP